MLFYVNETDVQLTKAEEQLMQILWEMGEGTVCDVREKFADPKPVRNTVSTVIRILENKGFVNHRSYGNVHVYFPLVAKREYSKKPVAGVDEKLF